jgi:hypothetical protein
MAFIPERVLLKEISACGRKLPAERLRPEECRRDYIGAGEQSSKDVTHQHVRLANPCPPGIWRIYRRECWRNYRLQIPICGFESRCAARRMAKLVKARMFRRFCGCA